MKWIALWCVVSTLCHVGRAAPASPPSAGPTVASPPPTPAADAVHPHSLRQNEVNSELGAERQWDEVELRGVRGAELRHKYPELDACLRQCRCSPSDDICRTRCRVRCKKQLLERYGRALLTTTRRNNRLTYPKEMLTLKIEIDVGETTTELPSWVERTRCTAGDAGELHVKQTTPRTMTEQSETESEPEKTEPSTTATPSAEEEMEQTTPEETTTTRAPYEAPSPGALGDHYSDDV